MTYRIIFFQLIMSMFFVVISSPVIAQQFPSGMPSMQEIEEINKTVEEYMSSLSPEELTEFNRQVEIMTQTFENMNEDEFEKFLTEMFNEDQMMESAPFDISPPPAPEVAVEVVLNAEDKKKVETALTILHDIVTQSNLFMVIVNSSVDLPDRINRWGTKGDIPNWPVGSSWNTLKVELETFLQKLHKAEDQDIVTKKYKYLFDLIADEALYNNLIQLQTELKSLLPAINIPEFNIQKLSTSSKTAIKNILKKYTEAFYLLGIPKSLDALFEKYAPEEEKIRLAEESATKKAIEAAKIPRNPVSPTEAGFESESGYDSSYSYGGGYGGSDYSSYSPYDYSSDYGYSPSYGNSYGSDSSSASVGKSSGGNRGGSNGSASGYRNQSDGESKEDKKEVEKEKNKQFTPNIKIERAIADIATGFKDIKTAMNDEENNPTNLGKLAATIIKNDIDVVLAGSTLPNIVDKRIIAMNDAIETIDKEKLTSNDLRHYQQELRNLVDKNKIYLETLDSNISVFEHKTAEEIEKAKKTAKKDEEKTTTDISELTPEKRWAYFDGSEEDLPAGDATTKLKETITSRSSLFSIKKNIDNFFDKTKKLLEKKSEIPVVQKKKQEVKSSE
ncbi:MAG TPA: hypothetical protein VLB80_02790 [Candidatus Babeliales bacterium]|nr:hypothetical protein [Candidatus Babeliales bacterium]